jgi:hypothetical protein
LTVNDGKGQCPPALFYACMDNLCQFKELGDSNWTKCSGQYTGVNIQ